MLLFDLGGVLVDIATFDALRAMVGESIDDDNIRDRWLRSAAVRSFELGRISPPEFAALFLAEWQVARAPEGFLHDFESWVREPYPGAERLLTRLRGRHHVSCFSNCNELHWARLTPLLACFDSAYSSHLLGAIKPDEEAFEAVVAELGVRPRDVRFFDDSRQNVESAQRLGIAAFLVDGIDDVARALGDGGLL